MTTNITEASEKISAAAAVGVLSQDANSDSDSGKDQVILIPQPSDDPHDPLNWSFRRKCVIGSVLCLTLFMSYTSAFNGQIQITQQAALYGKTTLQITYFNSAASGGLAAGAWLWWPLSKKIGRSATVLLTTVAVLIVQIWAANMRSSHDYNGFLAAKFFLGLFGQPLVTLGPLYIVDMFFLHQRGRAFNIMAMSLNLGPAAGPAFSGFITVHLPWWDEFWWTIALATLTIVLILIFVEDTAWDRTAGASNAYAQGSWIQRRMQTFLPGSNLLKQPTRQEMVDSILVPLKIAISPVLLLIAGFDAVSFGFYVALNGLTPVWLQRSVSEGGYGFSVLENAIFFTIVHFLTLVVAPIYGHLLSDRLPLWLCRRNEGKWKPEFRLHAMWVPNFILPPIGLGLVGAALEYRLHWIVLGIGSFLVVLGAVESIPITTNYTAECFRSHTVEAAIPLCSMRLFLGLTINFYINPWIAAVGVGWVYGTMAFFSVGSFGFIAVLMWKGHALRDASPFQTSVSEEGEEVLKQHTPRALAG
ncbi:major facilitator superfamily domain-containing protein [Xylariales sp. PMI_506]|nr:major facilitator superfamily domain-containing protein [Xylariales sp. PMI_506]